MSGAIAIEVTATGWPGVQAQLERLLNSDLDELQLLLASEVENQTRRRLSTEKKAPDGTAWKPWTEPYQETRRRGQSLLEAEGHLIDSIESFARTNEVVVGSNLVYAALHQFGGTPDMAPGPAAVPARPYLGVSDENERDLQALLEDFFRARLVNP